MAGTALAFVVSNPAAPRSGLERRMLEMLCGLRDAGLSVHVAGSVHPEYGRWSAEGRRELCDHGFAGVHVFEPDHLDRKQIGVLARMHRVPRLRSAVDSLFMTPPGMRHWFRRLAAELGPELVLITYAHYGRLLNPGGVRSMKRIIDMIDIVSLNRHMWRELQRSLPPPPIDHP